MKIMRIVGLGLAIIMLKFLVPRLFDGAENALLAFFTALSNILSGIDPGAMQAGILFH